MDLERTDESISEPNTTNDSDYCPSVDVSFENNLSIKILRIENLEEYKKILENTNISINLESDKKNASRRIRRKHHCQFCYLDVSNFARHLERNHVDEFLVQQMLSFDKNSKERKKLLDKLRKEGDFCSTSIVPVVTQKKRSYEDYLPCKFCKGYFAPKYLRKHAKRCYYNPDPTAKFKARIEGQNVMIGPLGPNDPLVKSNLFKMLKADEVSMVAKKDKIILEVARRYIKSHKENHLLMVAKRHMRRLSRLLISARKLLGEKKSSLENILKPSNFKILINATKEIAEYDGNLRTYRSPSLALQMGTLLKNAINAAISLEVQKENFSKEKIEKYNHLTTLLETDWASEISSEACQNLNINKFNKPSLIPAAEDIKKFELYLKDVVNKSKSILSKNPKNKKEYRNLLEVLFCSVLIFNKRRVGELQRMFLSTYLTNIDKTPSEEFQKVLTPTEKILCNRLKRVVIRGKRGRGVPVLIDKETQDDLDFLIGLRNNFNLKNNLFLFGVPDSTNSIQGYIVMRKHAKNALGDPNKAALLTSTKLRKHLGTIAQIFRMEKNDLEQLAGFMGHEKDTHMSWYRLPDDIYQTAKVSKLLMLTKNNILEKFKGKSLDEIELDLFLEETVEDELEDSNAGPSEINLQDNDDIHLIKNDIIDNNEISNNTLQPLPLTSKSSNLQTKRKLTPWTEKQKKLAEAHFAKHLKKKNPPKKKEVEDLINKYPNEFKNKKWTVIKVYICNKYSKKI